MKPENALENAKLALELADKWLGVPQVTLHIVHLKQFPVIYVPIDTHA